MTHSSRLTNRYIVIPALLGLMFGTVGRSEANQDIRIDDRAPTGPIFVTVNNVPVALLGDSTNDFVHFVYQAENNTPSPLSLSLSKDMLDPQAPFALSDRLLVTLTLGSSSVDVQFDSRLPVVLGKGQNDQGSVIENGLFQPMFSYDWGTASGTFFAASEIHPIPEPSTTWLMLAGLAGFIGLQRRWRVRQSDGQ